MQKKISKYLIPIVLVIIAFSLSECRKKEQILTDKSAKLEFSADSILFDTVFTTIGSTTKRFKIYNRNSQKMVISDIRLARGANSNFRINVDGYPGPEINSVEIQANDSLFVFVQVTVDPNNINTPLVIYDQILFNTNGNDQLVILEAWGQDAYFHKNEVICGSVTWPSDKPHVLYGIVAVGYPDICENSSLTIQPGTIVHGHVGSTLITYRSTLNAVGVVGNPVTFRGDRLEDYLLHHADSVSGQWRGIYFFEARESRIENATVRNAVIGIQVDTLTSANFVNINKVKIENSLFAGLITQGGNVKVENCLFGNSGQHSAVVSIGGNANFNHCTFGNYWSEGVRKTAALVITDYYLDANENPVHRPFTKADFTNCIIFGNVENEVTIDMFDGSSVLSFKSCFYKQNDDNHTPEFFDTNCIRNQDPLFIDPFSTWNFRLKTESPAKNKADLSFPTQFNDDIESKPRDAQPDLGCYEI
ncbi:MAG: hypothetical protein ACLGGV_01465 [Bacteroidia bacterium]